MRKQLPVGADGASYRRGQLSAAVDNGADGKKGAGFCGGPIAKSSVSAMCG